MEELIEKAVFVGIIRQNDDDRKVMEYLDELEFLAETAGAKGDKKFVQRLEKPEKATYIRSGKLQEIADYCEENEIKYVIFDDELTGMQQRNITQRGNRGSMVRLSLVGYTNVGKSTIMNLLAKSDVFAENKLFATLDTTVRKVVIENVPFLLSDTVGFIRKLPTQLVEAFKSTLDEVREADILLHVVDISHPGFEEQMEVVERTLQEIGASNKPVFVIFNKIDAYTYEEYDEFSLTPKGKENRSLDELKNSWIAQEKTPCIFISAINKTNIEKLRSDIYKMVAEIHAGRYPFNNFLW